MESTSQYIPESVRACIEENEWAKFWAFPEVNEPIDLMGWWQGVQCQVPNCEACTAYTPTGVDVERSFSYYRLSRSGLQSKLKSEHHIGRLSFRINGIVPAVAKNDLVVIYCPALHLYLVLAQGNTAGAFEEPLVARCFANACPEIHSETKLILTYQTFP